MHLEMSVNPSTVILIEVMYTCGENVQSYKWSLSTLKTAWTLKPWEIGEGFCLFVCVAITQFSSEPMESLRRRKTSAWLGCMPAVYFGLAVENPRVHLGISCWGQAIRSSSSSVSEDCSL